MKTDADFMELALSAAREAAAAGEVPIGAVVVRADEVIAIARNRVEEKHSVSAHAEFEAIRAVEAITGDWRMSDCTIYVTKEPCPMCAGMLVNARIRRIVFGAPDAATGGCGGAVDLAALPGALWHPEITGGVLAGESLRILQRFFRERRKK